MSPIERSGGGGGGGSTTGKELDYVQITANVTITSTTDGNGGGTAVIDGNAITFDGSTRVKVEFFSPVCEAVEGATGVGRLNVYDGTNDLGRITAIASTATETFDLSQYGALFVTPSAGAHTFHIRGWKVNAGGSFIVGAGAGGASTNAPAWYRVTVA